MIKGVIGGGVAARLEARRAEALARRTEEEPAEDNGFLELTPPQKAAVVISALGAESAAPLLRKLSEDDVRTFARASSELGDVPKEQVEAVIEEFIKSLHEDGIAMTPDKLKSLLSNVMSEDAIDRILEDLKENDGRSIWERLSHSEPNELANFLAREHPQTAAVVLSRIKPERAARVMMRFEEDFAEEVVMRLSKVAQLSPSVMEAVRDAIANDFLRSARNRKMKKKPDEMLGSIFNFMTNEKRDSLLGRIEAQSAPLAQAVQRKMFTIADVPKRVDRSSVSMIVRELDAEVLVKALAMAKKNAEETFEFMMGNISKRLAEQYREAIADAGPVNPKEGEEAQFELIGLIRRLSERGLIVLIQPEDDEEEDE